MTTITLQRPGYRDLTMTARQRAELAKLRIGHPRAAVTLPFRQRTLPLVRVRMRWPTRAVTVWLAPDGGRLLSGSSIGGPIR